METEQEPSIPLAEHERLLSLERKQRERAECLRRRARKAESDLFWAARERKADEGIRRSELLPAAGRAGREACEHCLGTGLKCLPDEVHIPAQPGLLGKLEAEVERYRKWEEGALDRRAREMERKAAVYRDLGNRLQALIDSEKGEGAE